ncbi:ATP synthase F1 subunit delta [Amniculibacterium sp. G2-70]|uniref:ATP synthase F1 subunit delta n=1 Tax=Amniculibacterium sp. G2-70 TaxID=2767188 RepID=UPI001653F645|nr:ATP synthase F1 subunit delta [Amniculibacterium sp. G2-70]
MLISKVAKRYAQGLLDFSTDTGNVSTVFNEMKEVVKVLDASKDLNAFFATPFIDAKKKEAAAAQIFVSFSDPSKKFISLVIKQGRETQLKNIAQEFINKVEDINGVQRITLTSATTLSPDNLDKILKSTSLFDASKKYELETIIKPEILGGFVLRIGDQQVDASVRTKLSNLKKEFQLN